MSVTSQNPATFPESPAKTHSPGFLESISLPQVWIFVFLLALSVSLLITYVVRPLLNIDRPLGGFAYDGYLELAQNLASGNGYVFEPGGHKVFHRPPLYPVLLAPGMFLPESLWRIYVAALNSALFALAAILFLKLATKLLFPRPVAILALLLFVLNPLLLVACKNAIPGILQVLAYLLTIYLTFQFLHNGQFSTIPNWQVLAYSLAFFLSVMSHGTMLPNAFLILSAIVLWCLHSRNWHMLRKTLFTAFLLLLFIAPWTWRNYRVTGFFIPVVGNSGLAYFAGNARWGITYPPVLPHERHHQGELRHMGLPPEKADELISFYGFTDARVDQEVNRRAKEHIRSHPLDLAKKVILNATEYYFPVIYYLIPPQGSIESTLAIHLRFKGLGATALAMSLFNLIIIGLALAGFRHLYRDPQSRVYALCLLFAWAAFAQPYLPFLTFFSGRSYYTFGTYPIIALLAGSYIARYIPAFRKAPDSSPAQLS